MSERGLIKIIFQNFLSSLRILRKTYVGKDHFGNKYYEYKVSPTRKHPRRWFEPALKDDFEAEIPAEWEGWLRGRRIDPPSEEEVLTSYKLIEQNKRNQVSKTISEQDEIQKDSKLKYPKYDDL